MDKQHFGLICPPLTSHITGLTSIGYELIERGHRVTMFNIPDTKTISLNEGVEFVEVGGKDHPLSSVKTFKHVMSTLTGKEALKFGIQTATKEVISLLRDVPEAMYYSGVTAIIGDQGSPVCSTIAEQLGIPFVSVCNAIANNRHPTIPPSFTGWCDSDNICYKVRNILANKVVDYAVSPITKAINTYRRTLKFKDINTLEDTFSNTAQISQQSKAFDFYNPSLPSYFHYVGLLNRKASDDVPFPYHMLDGKPLVYVSLGTVMGDRDIYNRVALSIVKACDFQLVVSLGDDTDWYSLPGNTIVVPYAPQRVLLNLAELTICHGGLNTVLESLKQNVPVITLPMVTDQFAVGARLQKSGAGLSINRSSLTDKNLTEAIRTILGNSKFSNSARYIGQTLINAGGEVVAADIIESVVCKIIMKDGKYV